MLVVFQACDNRELLRIVRYVLNGDELDFMIVGKTIESLYTFDPRLLQAIVARIKGSL